MQTFFNKYTKEEKKEELRVDVRQETDLFLL